MGYKVKYVYIKMLNKVDTVLYWFDFWENIANENNKDVHEVYHKARNFLERCSYDGSGR